MYIPMSCPQGPSPHFSSCHSGPSSCMFTHWPLLSCQCLAHTHCAATMACQGSSHPVNCAAWTKVASTYFRFAPHRGPRLIMGSLANSIDFPPTWAGKGQQFPKRLRRVSGLAVHLLTLDLCSGPREPLSSQYPVPCTFLMFNWRPEMLAHQGRKEGKGKGCFPAWSWQPLTTLANGGPSPSRNYLLPPVR